MLLGLALRTLWGWELEHRDCCIGSYDDYGSKRNQGDARLRPSTACKGGEQHLVYRVALGEKPPAAK